MKELQVKIKYTNFTNDFTANDVEYALKFLFGINTCFKVEEIRSHTNKEETYRRRDGRINTNIPLAYINDKEIGSSLPALTKNLSLNGIKILSQKYLKPQTTVKFTLNLNDELTKFGAQVVWCKKETEQDSYWAGLRFTNVCEKTKKELECLIENTDHQ